jgi:hypothetical protein
MLSKIIKSVIFTGITLTATNIFAASTNVCTALIGSWSGQATDIYNHTTPIKVTITNLLGKAPDYKPQGVMSWGNNSNIPFNNSNCSVSDEGKTIDAIGLFSKVNNNIWLIIATDKVNDPSNPSEINLAGGATNSVKIISGQISKVSQ